MSAESTVRSALFNVLSQLNAQKETLSLPMTTALDELNQSAARAGMKMFWLNNTEEAEHFLTIASAAQFPECQFSMATCNVYRDGIWHSEHGKLSSYASEETKKWLKLAAAQNYIPALIQLGDTESLETAKTLVSTFPAYKEPEGMYYQYLITDDVSWLEKSAAAGFSLAQFKLAEQYQRHPKLIANDALRLARIEELYQESADAGLPLALYARVFFGDSTASMAEKRTRLARLADLGHVEAMMEYGHALANMPLRERPAPDEDGSEPPFTNPYGLEKNLPLAYALLKHVQKSMPAPIPPRLPADIHKIEMRMNLEDHEQAKLALAAVESNTPQLFVRLEELIIPGTAK
ncbi:hypothetical protein K7402_01840 [Pseudomonas fluorescens group sp.]|uniref:Sel1 repeat family protein n=2 Tax=Pseudomonas fluorescens TaxID=294 RepID=C3KCK9_PSEFS|nr:MULTISPECIES: hypothetical protein [Pseudomonas fluorescens group]MBZ6456198.1 hypothetical protein [Pseudomonas fluorescens group sp.]MBZ6460509.1 hypothetical protein [Pseudomonas fluorescens group sp.]MBZ6466151.1 hypothetical protein [Pseudomonas fluorescens group sp.]WQD69862.1 hypothetical protein U0037_17515 [Pseudomonas marginalis]CAI2797711.1 Uncharacterized protein PFLU_3503 [Pseudomonas fluorescens SBW25]